MKKNKIVLYSMLSSLGVFVYISLVVLLLDNGERIFGRVSDNFIVGILMLMLLVISAGITGSLVFGGPIWMYLEKKKKEAIQMLIYNFLWLLLFLSLIILSIIIF